VHGRRTSERNSLEGSHWQTKSLLRLVAVMSLLFAVLLVVSEQVKLEGRSTARFLSSGPFWSEHVRRSVGESSSGVRRSPSHLIRAVRHHPLGPRPRCRQMSRNLQSSGTNRFGKVPRAHDM